MRLLTQCQPTDVTAADYRRSAAWMIGVTLILAAVYIAVNRAFGENAFVEAFGAATFPIAICVSCWATYFKPYSRAARVALVAGLSTVVFAIALGAELLGRMF